MVPNAVICVRTSSMVDQEQGTGSIVTTDGLISVILTMIITIIDAVTPINTDAVITIGIRLRS